MFPEPRGMEGYGCGFNIRFSFCPLQDKVAMESIPLLGFTIAPEKEAGSNEAGPVFHLYHKKTLFYSFKAEDSNSAQRYQQWLVFCLTEKCGVALHCSTQAPGAGVRVRVGGWGGSSITAGLHILGHET